MEAQSSASRLLTGHFLRRFLDNDLISPNADRHETLTVGATMLISFGLFATVLLASKYVINPFPTPMHMALGAMQDRVLFVGASMLVMGLVAVAQWEALSIDVLDAAILGPLPVGRWTIVRAKLAALALFTAAFAVILNTGPAVLFPLFFAAQLPLSLLDIVTMLAAHALITLLAGVFGVACIVALRESLRALLGARLFVRVSTFLQAALVVLGVTALLLLPGRAPRIADDALNGSAPAIVAPLGWFIGLHEVVAGRVLTSVPARRVPSSISARERKAAAFYQSNVTRFRLLAATAVPALTLVTGLALVAFLWNNRRLPLGVSRAAGRPAWRRWLVTSIERWGIRSPVARAGFFFTLQVLPRSVPHRVAMATAAAAGLATATIALGGVELTRVDAANAAIGVWAVQMLVMVALLGGFRHAIRVPAELRASPSFLMAWPGEEVAYLRGAKRAAVVALVLPAVVVFLPLHVVVFGARGALLHALCGLLTSWLLLEALCYGLRQPPFACGYLPAGSFKRAAPIYLAAVIVSCYTFAGIERAAITSDVGAAVLFATLLGGGFLIRMLDRRSRQHPVEIDIDEMPETFQRLDLSG